MRLKGVESAVPVVGVMERVPAMGAELATRLSSL
jgi:hypothetical protein